MKLPSIHTLLNPPPSPPTYNNNTNSSNNTSSGSNNNYSNASYSQPPSVHVLPASPVPSPLDTSATLSPMLSPALSSTRSPSISSVGSISPMTMNLSEFPPIHGDDPPRRLVHSSPSLQPRSPTHYLHHHHHQHHQQNQHHSKQQPLPWKESIPPPSSALIQQQSYPVHNSTSPATTTLPTPPHMSSPSPPSIVISPSSSTSTSSRTTIKSTSSASSSSLSSATKQTNSTTKKEDVPAPPPCTQIFISPTGQPILKRRRGRPPTRSPGYDEGGWTFLSPTVWDVTSSSQSSATPSSYQQGNTLQGQHQERSPSHNPMMEEEEGTMNDSMTAFTSANMDTVLPMPKKKRGRKPKTHIEGNSCFVWKDITASRRTPSSSLSSNKPSSPKPLIN